MLRDYGWQGGEAAGEGAYVYSIVAEAALAACTLWYSPVDSSREQCSSCAVTRASVHLSSSWFHGWATRIVEELPALVLGAEQFPW